MRGSIENSCVSFVVVLFPQAIDILVIRELLLDALDKRFILPYVLMNKLKVVLFSHFVKAC